MRRLIVVLGIAAVCAAMCLAGCGTSGMQSYSGELEEPQAVETDQVTPASSPDAGQTDSATPPSDADSPDTTIVYNPEEDPDYAEVKAYLQMEAQQQEPVYELSGALQLANQATEHDSDGLQVFYLNEQPDPSVIIIYLHGGYYVSQIESAHWTMLDSIVSSTECQAIVPLYHVAPWGTCELAYQQLTDLYLRIKQQYPQSKIVLLGDSSGGGLALGFAQSLVQAGIEGPQELVLLSPWVDATGSNPECLPYQGVDPVLSLAVGKVCSETWAQNLSTDDWRVSPLFGEMSGLGNVTLFVGTNEMFYPDILLLADKLRAADVPVDLYVGQGQYHIYPALQTPEGIEARELIAQVVTR